MAIESEASVSTPPLSPIALSAGDVEVTNDGYLSFAGLYPDVQLHVDNILTVLPSKTAKFVTAFLKEVSDDSETPFELALLTSDSLPDDLLQKHLISAVPLHLASSDTRKVDIVVSTKSGTGKSLAFWKLVFQPLWDLVHGTFGATQSISEASSPTSERQATVLITQSADSVPHFARSLWSSVKDSSPEAAKSRTVVLLSGDGGVVDLLNGRDFETPPNTPLSTIALVPLGTGNALFHSLHKPAYSSPGPSPLVLSLRTLLRGSSASLPVFRASFSQGAHIVAPGGDDSTSSSGGDESTRPVSHLDGAIVASYGFHASLVYESDTPAYRLHGDKRFGMVAQELLRESHPYTAQVEIRRPGASSSTGWEALPRDEHAYVLTTLVSNLEKAFTISPASKPLDGQLRTVHFGNIGGERAMQAMTKAYDGGKHVDVKWDDGERIYYEDIEEIKITVKEEDARWRKICVDGTIVDVPTGGHVTVSKLAQSPLQILVDSAVIRS